jgi:hypothetical protein
MNERARPISGRACVIHRDAVEVGMKKINRIERYWKHVGM